MPPSGPGQKRVTFAGPALTAGLGDTLGQALRLWLLRATLAPGMEVLSILGSSIVSAGADQSPVRDVKVPRLALRPRALDAVVVLRVRVGDGRTRASSRHESEFGLPAVILIDRMVRITPGGSGFVRARADRDAATTGSPGTVPSRQAGRLLRCRRARQSFGCRASAQPRGGFA